MRSEKAGISLDEESYKKDAELSPEGAEYAERLKNFVLFHRAQKDPSLMTSPDQERSLSVRSTYSVTSGYARPLLNYFVEKVWSSTQKKGRQTANAFEGEHVNIRNYSVLNQLNPGEVDGLSAEQIAEKYPDEVERANKDPYRHRYPRAEV